MSEADIKFLDIGERKSKRALAHIRVEWRRTVGPMVRKAYGGGDGPTDPDVCERIADRLEGFASAAREAARLARVENDHVARSSGSGTSE